LKVCLYYSLAFGHYNKAIEESRLCAHAQFKDTETHTDRQTELHRDITQTH